MLKRANIFFKRLRISYLVLIAVTILQRINPDIDMILFTIAFVFIGAFFDILTDVFYTADKVEKIKNGKQRKAVR